MRILYFSPRDCWPLTTGARVRDYHLARQLAQRADLTYLGFASDPQQREVVRSREGIDAEIDQITVPRPDSYSPLQVFRGLAGPTPISVLNYSTGAMVAELARLLSTAKWDLVQMEGVHLSSYIKVIRNAESQPHLVSDWHNIESELMSRFGQNSSTPFLKQVYARRTASLLQGMENRLLRMCDAHLVCSERERGILLSRLPAVNIQVIGNGVDVDFYSSGDGPPVGSRRVVFVGSMDYHANIDAALYFANEIWPVLRGSVPDLEFVIVGSRPAPSILALSQIEGITVTGTVPDVRPYYRSAAAVVVPLRVGSGTRLKVLEAMAAGVPIVSTRLGVEGIDFIEGRHLITAEDPVAFSAALERLLNDETARQRLSAGGLELVRSSYDWKILGSILFNFYASLAGLC